MDGEAFYDTGISPNGWVYANVGDCGLQTYQTVTILKRATAFDFSTIPPILYIPC